MEHPIDKAARVAGSRAALARALGVTKAAVGQWREPGRRVPAEHCPVIERLTADLGERVSCEELRPDVEWHVLRGAAADAPSAPAPSEVQIHPVTVAAQTVTAGAPPAGEQQEAGQAEEAEDDRKRVVPTAFGERRTRPGTKADRGGADTMQAEG